MALWGKNILGRRKSECKSPEGETCQVPALFRNYNGVQCGGKGVNKGKEQGQNPVAIRFSFWVKWQSRDFPGGPVTKTPHSQCRGLGSIPDQRTRSTCHRLQQRSKTLQAATKTAGRQTLFSKWQWAVGPTVLYDHLVEKRWWKRRWWVGDGEVKRWVQRIRGNYTNSGSSNEGVSSSWIGL